LCGPIKTQKNRRDKFIWQNKNKTGTSTRQHSLHKIKESREAEKNYIRE
jgi:hypothetical protein